MHLVRRQLEHARAVAGSFMQQCSICTHLLVHRNRGCRLSTQGRAGGSPRMGAVGYGPTFIARVNPAAHMPNVPYGPR